MSLFYILFARNFLSSAFYSQVLFVCFIGRCFFLVSCQSLDVMWDALFIRINRIPSIVLCSDFELSPSP